MAKTLANFRKEFVLANNDIADISNYSDIPDELSGEDVYDYFFLFRNEQIVVDFVCREYKMPKEKVLQELHEEDSLREKYGKENYLRSVQVSYAIFISELLDGTYILWKAY